MDFIRPLKDDSGFNSILSITDHMGADIHIVPTQIDITAEDLAVLFFDHWYCENGLPLDIISNRDKLFMSHCWNTLHSLCRVKLKMSTAYHPQMDGSNEWMNKTINQALLFHVDRQQRGWEQALPRICSAIMNTVNASTGFSNFPLHLGQSPCVIPLLIPSSLPQNLCSTAMQVEDVIAQINIDLKTTY